MSTSNRKSAITRKCCEICKVTFNRLDIRKKRVVCYKPHCEYSYCLIQQDLWRERARSAAIAMDFYNDDSCYSLTKAGDTTFPHAISAEPSTSTTTCGVPSCNTALSVQAMEYLHSHVGAIVASNTMGDMVGRCVNCPCGSNVVSKLYCDQHFNKHYLHDKHHGVKRSASGSLHSSTSTKKRVQVPIFTVPSLLPQLPDWGSLIAGDDDIPEIDPTLLSNIIPLSSPQPSPLPHLLLSLPVVSTNPSVLSPWSSHTQSLSASTLLVD